MKSEHATDLLHDYLDGALSSTEESTVMRHVESCPSCRETLTELQALKRSLALWPAPALRAEAAERMLQTAVRAPATVVPWWSGPLWNRAGLAAAAMMLVVLGFGSGLWMAHRDQPGPQVTLAAQAVELGPNEQTVGLLFRASVKLEDASISVWLPDDVQIAGRPNVRQLTWQTDLKEGANLLELPLLATGVRGGTLLVHLSQGSLVRVLEVPITIRRPRTPAASSVPPRGPSALS